MIRSTKDFWTGLIYIFFGSGAIIIALDYDMGKAIKMGPGYFPTVLGSLLILIGIISVARSFLKADTPIESFSFKGLALVVFSVVLFGVLVRGAGVVIALPLLVILSAVASRQFRWIPTVLLAFGLTLFCILVFLKGLGIPLPLLGPWFGG
jgi:hypothetical protein